MSLTAALLALWAADGLRVEYGPEGLKSLGWQGAELLAAGAFQIEASLEGGKRLDLSKPLEARSEGGTCTRRWEGLSASWTWTPQGDVLRLRLSVRNAGAVPLSRVAAFPATLRFPRRPAGGVWFWNYDVTTSNEGEPGLVEADWGGGKLVLAVDEPEKPGVHGFQGNFGNADTNRLLLETARGETVAPGAERTWRISLRFAPGGTPTAAMAAEVYREFARRFPPLLRWPDRRPIGAIFLARDNTKWKTNPRGWFNDEKVDVTTEAGRAAFRERLLRHAETCIAELRKVGAQGMVVWDVEGAEMPHAVTYLGDPRFLPAAAPEMDACADEYFRKFREAGFRTGVCIRPSRMVPDPARREGPWKHVQVDDPVAEMADKIAVAKRRWGCSIFYMDTNVVWEKGMWQGASRLLHTREIRDLCARHPDVLIFPEFGRFGYHGACGVYGELRGGRTRTDERVRAAYPEACTVIAVGDGDFLGRWEELLEGASKGDIHLFRGWFGDTANRWVREMQREIEFRRRPAPAGGTPESRLEDPDPAVRYAALSRLARPDAAQAALVARRLGEEKDWLVRRELVKALGRSGAVGAVEPLVAALQDPGGGLEEAAAGALAALGPLAAKALAGLAGSGDARVAERALEALGRIGDPSALPVLLEHSRSGDPRRRELAARGLGSLGDPAAGARLLEMLRDPHKAAVMAACEALGRRKDRAAVRPLVELVERAVKELRDNDVRSAAGRALEEITGEQHGPYEQRWRRALESGRLGG